MLDEMVSSSSHPVYTCISALCCIFLELPLLNQVVTTRKTKCSVENKFVNGMWELSLKRRDYGKNTDSCIFKFMMLSTKRASIYLWVMHRYDLGLRYLRVAHYG